MHYLSAVEASPSNSPAAGSQFSASVLYFYRKAPASILNIFYTHQDRQLLEILTINIYTRAIRSLITKSGKASFMPFRWCSVWERTCTLILFEPYCRWFPSLRSWKSSDLLLLVPLDISYSVFKWDY